MKAAGGATPLMYACQQCRENEVLEILRKQPYSVNERDRTLKTPLHYCAENPNSSCAEAILKARPEIVNAQDENGYCTLHLAVIAGNKPLIKLLITKGADVNINDNEGHSAVHWAIVSSEKEALEMIIRAGADPSTPDIHGGYPLHYAVQMCGCNCGHAMNCEDAVRVVEALLNFGVDVNVKDKDGRQPILWAASAGSPDAVVHLISGGACVEAADKDGLTALHCAASRGHTTTLETLITLCGANVDVIDGNGCSALFYSVTLGHADATQLLLQLGAEPNRQDRKGRTPAHCGAAKGQLETLRILQKHGGNLWMRNVKGDIPLHEAVASGRKDLVLWLLSQCSEAINIANNDGRCPLHIAAMYNNTEMVKVLLDSKSLVNPVMRTSKGVLMTPLNVALSKGHRSCGKYLQLHGGVPFSKVSQAEPTTVFAVRVSPSDDVLIETEEKVKEGGSLSHISKSRSSTDFQENQAIVRTEPTDKKKVYRRRKKKKNTSNMLTQDSDSDCSVQDLKTPDNRKREGRSEDDHENDDGQIKTLIVESDAKTFKKRQNVENSSAKVKTPINKKEVLEEPIIMKRKEKEKIESKLLLRNKSFNETKNVSDLSPEDFPPLMQTINQLDAVIMETDIDGRKVETENNETKPETPEAAHAMGDQMIDTDKKEETATVGNAAPRKEEIQDEKNEKESSSFVEKSGKTLKDKKQSGGKEEGVKSLGWKGSDEDSIRKSVKISKNLSNGGSIKKDSKTGKKTVGSGSGNHKEIANAKDLKLREKTLLDTSNRGDVEVEKLSEAGTNISEGIKESEKSETEAEKPQTEVDENIIKTGTPKAKVEETKEEIEKLKVETVKNEEETEKPEREEIKEETEKPEVGEKTEEKSEKSKIEIEKTKEETEKAETGTEKTVVELKVTKLEAEETKIGTEKPEAVAEESKEETKRETKVSFSEAGTKEKVESSVLEEKVTESRTRVTRKLIGEQEEEKSENDLTKNKNSEISKNESSEPETVVVASVVEEAKTSETKISIEEARQEETPVTTTTTIEASKETMVTPSSGKVETNSQKLSEVFLPENQVVGKTSETKNRGTGIESTRRVIKADVPEEIEERSVSSETPSEELEENREKAERKTITREQTEKSESIKQKSEVDRINNCQDYGVEGTEGEVSFCSPEKKTSFSKMKTPKVSRLCRRNRDFNNDMNQISVTQLVQNTIRKYHMERGIFYQLLELKRYQIRSGKANEQVLVKRLADEYERSRVFLGMKPFSGLYRFKEFEKFLYDQLKALNSRRSFIVPEVKSYDDIDALSGFLKKSRYKILSETPPPEMVCTCITQRCHHSACAYTSVPCSAYVSDLRRHRHHKPRRESFFPRIEQVPPGKTEPQGQRERPATLELIQGSEKHVITLPQGTPTGGKRYFVTFTIKGAPAFKEEDFVGESKECSKHRHAKSV